MADALSRKAELASITTFHCHIQDAVRDGMQHDPEAKKLMELAAQGRTRRFWVEDGLLLTSGRRVYVPKFGSIRRRIIKESHDTPWAGHPGQRKTRALIEAIYFWPRMRDEIECYLQTYLMWKQDKVEQRSHTRWSCLHTSKSIRCFMQASSSHTMRTKKTLDGTKHDGPPLLSPPRTTGRLRQ